MLGSLQEAQDVLANRGVELDTKTVRTIAYRYAARARLEQQVNNAAFEDSVAGRRVVISSDGGRIRLREIKRGPKSTKGRRRYTGAWREPKVLIVYVVDAEGKREASFAPFIDATLKGPDAVFALLRSYLQRLEITQADQVLFIADGAPWIWKRVPLLVQALAVMKRGFAPTNENGAVHWRRSYSVLIFIAVVMPARGTKRHENGPWLPSTRAGV